MCGLSHPPFRAIVLRYVAPRFVQGEALRLFDCGYKRGARVAGKVQLGDGGVTHVTRGGGLLSGPIPALRVSTVHGVVHESADLGDARPGF